MLEAIAGLEWIIISIFVLLVLSGCFSASETALTAASRPKMHVLEKDGNARAAIVNLLRKNSDRLLSAILLGNNLVNVFATALTTMLFTKLFGDGFGLVYATVAMTITVVIFAEVLPKTYAITNADNSALMVARPIRLWLLISSPITYVLRYITNAILKPLGLSNNHDLSQSLSDDELRGAIDLHGRSEASDDVETQQEREMLRSILDLADVNVAQVMTHRRNVVALNLDQDVSSLVDAVLASQYTRLPLWQNDDGNIIGVLHVKALLRALQQTDDVDGLSIQDLLADPWFIPETANLLDQLQAFRERREHFAIVVDEYGSLKGIVTLEDILEEIVGDITDELDTPVTGVRQHADGTSWLVQGSVAVRDINREFEWSLPDEKAVTVGGLILHEARKIPDAGQVFTFYGFRFEVLRRQRNQITLVKITPPAL